MSNILPIPFNFLLFLVWLQVGAGGNAGNQCAVQSHAISSLVAVNTVFIYGVQRGARLNISLRLMIEHRPAGAGARHSRARHKADRPKPERCLQIGPRRTGIGRANRVRDVHHRVHQGEGFWSHCCGWRGRRQSLWARSTQRRTNKHRWARDCYLTLHHRHSFSCDWHSTASLIVRVIPAAPSCSSSSASSSLTNFLEKWRCAEHRAALWHV